jgi:hypothetical protein
MALARFSDATFWLEGLSHEKAGFRVLAIPRCGVHRGRGTRTGARRFPLAGGGGAVAHRRLAHLGHPEPDVAN